MLFRSILHPRDQIHAFPRLGSESLLFSVHILLFLTICNFLSLSGSKNLSDFGCMTGKKKSELSSTLLPDFLCNCIQYSTTFPEMQGFLKYMPDSLCKGVFHRSLSAILLPGYLLPSHLPRLHHLHHVPPLFLRCIPPGLP